MFGRLIRVEGWGIKPPLREYWACVVAIYSRTILFVWFDSSFYGEAASTDF